MSRVKDIDIESYSQPRYQGWIEFACLREGLMMIYLNISFFLKIAI